MAEPISIQQLKDASEDAQSLSEFVFKPASLMVARRLAPPVHPLQFYIDRFNSLNGDFSSSVSVALSSLNSSVAEAEGKVTYIETTVQDAINNTAVEGGILADTFVTMTADGIGSIPRTLRDIKRERISVKDFGAKGDGVADDTAAIQKAINYAQTRSDSRALTGVGLFNTAFVNIVFPSGYYKISSTLELGGNRNMSIGSEDKAVIFGEGAKEIDLFTGTHVWKLYVKGITFFNFNKVFNITSNNLDYAKWYFTECQVQRVNVFVDAGSYAKSRSTSVVFDRCDSQYSVGQFARMFCDTVSFINCWLAVTEAGKALVYGNSLFNFNGCAFLPTGEASGAGTSYIHLSDDDGAGGTVKDKNRGVTIDSCRVSNEGGNPPLVVSDYAIRSGSRPEGGPIITISNMAIVGFHPRHYEEGGTETGIVHLLKYPESISFNRCTFDALGDPTSYLVAKNSTLTEKAHNRFNVWLDDSSKKSAAAVANSYGYTSKIADSLRGFINNPDPTIFMDLMEFGYIPVVDSATVGVKKATFKLKTGYSAPNHGTIPTTFMLILTGQDRDVGSSPVYAGSSVYIVSLTGLNNGAARNKIQATKLHGPMFSLYEDANADIVSIHFGTEDTGSSLSINGAEQTVTVTFGANIKYGKAKIINYIEQDGFYHNKPLI